MEAHIPSMHVLGKTATIPVASAIFDGISGSASVLHTSVMGLLATHLRQELSRIQLL